MLERLDLQELQHDEGLALVLANLVNGGDVGMAQSRCRAGLALETLECLPVPSKVFGQKPQGDKAAQLRVLSLVDHARPPAAKLFQHALM